MNKFIKAIGLLSITAIFGLGVFAQNANAQSSFINTGVTINKATDLEPTTFAGTRYIPYGTNPNLSPFSLTLNFSGGPVSGSDLNMDVYILLKKADGTMNKVATLNYNGNACTRGCYDQTIPTPTSKWGSTTAVPLWRTMKIPNEAEPGNYSIRVAFRRGNTYAKMVPGPGVVEYNDSILESSNVPSYEVGTFAVVVPCTKNIDSHYTFNTNSNYAVSGFSGPEVVILQNVLKSMGFYERGINGSYDSYTATAAKKFQKSIGLPETGIGFLPNLNDYCDSQVKPVITRITKTNAEGSVVEAKTASYGQIITIEGRNFFSGVNNSYKRGAQSLVEFGPYNAYSVPISIEPNKIVARARSTQYSDDSYIMIDNRGVKSERIPFRVGGGSYVFGEPEITKINGKPAPYDATPPVVKLGEILKLEGVDFNLDDIAKATFTGPISEVVPVTDVTNTSAYVKVPLSLSKAQVFSIRFMNAAGESKGNSVSVRIAGNIDPAITFITPKSLFPGEEIQVIGTDFSANLKMYLTKGSESVILSSIPTPSDASYSLRYKVPSEIATGEYSVSLRTGNGIEDNKSNSVPLIVKYKDTVAPSAPSKPVSTRINSDSIRLDWTASTDNVGVVGYDVYRGGAILPRVGTNSIVLDKIDSTTPEKFSVVAVDAAGNYSPSSPYLEINLPPAPVLISVTPASTKKFQYITVKGTNLATIRYGYSVMGDLSIVLPNSSMIKLPVLPPYSANYTEIYTVIPDLPPGEYGLRSTTYTGTSNTLKFTILPDVSSTPTVVRQAPVITSITPGKLRSGEKLVIAGKNFLSDGVSTATELSDVILTNSSNVTVARATILSKSNTRVEIQIPSNLQGLYNVVIVTVGSGKSNPWTVVVEPAIATPQTPVTPVTPPVAPTKTPAPVINSVLPLGAKAGDTVTLYGSNFTGVISDLISISDSRGSISPEVMYSASASSVTFKMPNLPAGAYYVELTANSGTSNRIVLNALQTTVQISTPYISSVSPSSAKPNTLITLTGTNFEGVTSDLLFIENSTGSRYLDVVSSSATSVTFRVPNIPAGAYKVYLFADKGESNWVDFTVQGNVSALQSIVQTATVFDWFISLFQ